MSKGIQAWQCEKCGKAFLSKRAADECCKEKKPYTCRVCGCEVKEYHLICGSCHDKERYEKAKKVKYSEYNIGCLWDEQTDKYFYDVGEMEDYYEDEDLEMPKWCYGCTEVPFEIDIDHAIENASEEMYEDFDNQDINDLEELYDYIEQWNKKQTAKAYYSDYDTVVLLEE